MYYDYEDKRYHDGNPPGGVNDSAEPVMTGEPKADLGGKSNIWSDPAYGAADEKSTYSPGYHHSGTGYRTYNSRYRDPVWDKPEKKRRKTGAGKKFLRAVCLVLVCAIVSAGVGYGVADYRISKMKPAVNNQVVLGASTVSTAEGSAVSDKTDSTPLAAIGDSMSASQIYELACRQVVGIQTEASSVNIFGQSTRTAAVSGSGFVISSDGYVVTNYHVVEYAVVYGAQYGYATSVLMEDGTAYPAEIIGYEKDNDIAVLKIEAENLNPVAIGSSSDMKVGDTIYTVGNPLGELEYTMTSGIVSALDREISTENSVAVNMFQIDAAVNSGNSGGPVYNARGEVIGVVTAKYSSTGVEGIGFAIPMDDTVNIVTDLIEHGYVTGKAYLGVYARTVGSTIAQYYNLPAGAYIEVVMEGYAAEEAGLQLGDIVTKVDDTVVDSKEALTSSLRSYSAGDSAKLTVYRNGQYLEFTVSFDEKPRDAGTEIVNPPAYTNPNQNQGGA